MYKCKDRILLTKHKSYQAHCCNGIEKIGNKEIRIHPENFNIWWYFKFGQNSGNAEKGTAVMALFEKTPQIC